MLVVKSPICRSLKVWICLVRLKERLALFPSVELFRSVVKRVPRNRVAPLVNEGGLSLLHRHFVLWRKRSLYFTQLYDPWFRSI
jgi:hypothetical protein